MSARFLIVFEPRAEEVPVFERARRLPGLEIVCDSRGLLVMVRSDCPHERLPNGRGVIVGRTRRAGQAGPAALAELGTGFGRAVLGSGGSVLFDHVWGEYLAVVVERDRSAFVIARDPSGAIPCYLHRQDGLSMVSDDLSHLDALATRSAEIAQESLCGMLVYRDLRSRRTCLAGIEEIFPGEVALVAPSGIATLHQWTPTKVLRARPAHSTWEAAVDGVGSAVRLAVDAQLRGVARPLVTVSGGLDSSIVSACLSAGRETIGFTTLYPGPHGDERRYVEPLARHLGLRLHAGEPSLAAIDLVSSRAADLPRPCARSLLGAEETLLARLRGTMPFDAVFTGNGGDGVLGYLFSALPLLDRLERPGGWRDIVRLADRIALMHGVTIWEVLGRARRARKSPAPAWPRDLSFVRDGRDLAVPYHPWLDDLEEVALGKRSQIRSLVSMHNHFEGSPLSRRLPVLSPLASQPVVETCLAVPSWFNVAGGRNRAVARAAFADVLPPEVARRVTKGGPEGLGLAIYDRHRADLRSMLLDGALRQRGLIDGPSLEAALLDDRTRADGRWFRICLLADAEAWVRARLSNAGAPPTA